MGKGSGRRRKRQEYGEGIDHTFSSIFHFELCGTCLMVSERICGIESYCCKDRNYNFVHIDNDYDCFHIYREVIKIKGHGKGLRI